MNAVRTPRPDWVYQGAEAGKNPDLTPDQRAYAITLRRQLATRLAHEAVAHRQGLSRAGHDFAASYWRGIEKACYREGSRMTRALDRLEKEARA